VSSMIGDLGVPALQRVVVLSICALALSRHIILGTVYHVKGHLMKQLSVLDRLAVVRRLSTVLTVSGISGVPVTNARVKGSAFDTSPSMPKTVVRPAQPSTQRRLASAPEHVGSWPSALGVSGRTGAYVLSLVGLAEEKGSGSYTSR